MDILMGEQQIEQIITYGSVALLCLAVILFYFRVQRKNTKKVVAKIEQAKLDGLYEPVSLHPVVDPKTCIGTGACITACPEKDILGLIDRKATTINASRCIGHGACFHACPTEAITLVIGTEKRGVDLPHVNMMFETNVPGLYIAGELGGMGLIKNAVEQGRQAVENIFKFHKKEHKAQYDLIIVGAGPAGISAGLAARKHKLNFLILEQDTLGGAVYHFPRSKIVMTSAMDLPLYGKVKLFETSKTELLGIWQKVLTQHDIPIMENAKVEAITPMDGQFLVEILAGEQFTAKNVLLAIGRRGTPRKLNIPGENLEKVAYRLLEPEDISGKDIVIVGGGDSAIEAALSLATQNKVILAYRSDAFQRIKQKNSEKIFEAMSKNLLDVRFNTNLIEIAQDEATLESSNDGRIEKIRNDMVYIFAGGELPTEFLRKIGIDIKRKFGEAVLKH
jgi:thioredoxin reductase (NADPH)